jgi:hypothetical protein
LFAALWIVLELLVEEEQLLTGREHKIGSTVSTFQNFVDEIHPLPSPSPEAPAVQRQYPRRIGIASAAPLRELPLAATQPNGRPCTSDSIRAQWGDCEGGPSMRVPKGTGTRALLCNCPAAAEMRRKDCTGVWPEIRPQAGNREMNGPALVPHRTRGPE